MPQTYMHRNYFTKRGGYFACLESVGTGSEDWDQVTCPECLRFAPYSVLLARGSLSATVKPTTRIGLVMGNTD